MSGTDRARLLELLRTQSYERRRVVLASGRESDFYIDCKRTALTAEGHALIGRLLLALVRTHAPTAAAVGGLTLGADPLASAVSLTSFLEPREGKPLAAFLVRKEPKGHGTGQWLERAHGLVAGTKVAILEDVVTTGASTLKAVERAEEEGMSVEGAFGLVDRQEGGREALTARNVPLWTLFTREDFLK